MLCPPTNAVKTPLLGCLPNTEIILITSCALFFVSSRHNYGKFRLHGLQPSCQDTMPSGSLTCEIPILEVAKKHGMRSKSSSPLEFFYWSSPKIMQKQLHLSLNSPCSNWKTDNNETSRSNSGSQEKLPFLCLLTAARWRNKTLLSRRQHKLRVKEFHCKLMQVQLQILLWSLCHIYFSTMRFSWKSCLPLDLFKLADVKIECITVFKSVCSHAFTLFPANILVPSNIVGSLLKIPPLRSRGTSAQKIKET